MHYRRVFTSAAATPLSLIFAAFAPALARADDPLPPPPHCDLCDPCNPCGKSAAMRLRFVDDAGNIRFVLRDPADPAVGDDEPLLTPQEALGDTDLQHVALEIEVLPATSSIVATASLTLRSTVANLTEFTFRLRSNFTITSATVGGTPVVVTGLSTTSRRLTLPRAFAANETFTLSLAYNGVPVSRGLGSWSMGTQGGQPLIATLSEPYYAYTWWPSKEGDTFEPGNNADKSTFAISIIAPSNLTSVSNGLLQGIDPLSGGRSRTRWATNYPTAPYLACFATTDYVRWTRTFAHPGAPGGVMPVEFYIYTAQDTPARRAEWEKSLDALAVYSPIFGPYPFPLEKYGVYQFPFGGGMEHQTMTGMGVFNENVTVHELAHQWWGDAVTCRTWNDIWLNEGMATYSEALWYELKAGSTGLPALRAAMNNRRPGNTSDSVYCYDVTSPNRIFSNDYSYRKAGWAVHSLRRVLGDSAFFAGLNAYRAAYEGSAATTDDFKNSFIASSGIDLTNFFNQFVYGTGAPAYAFATSPRLINGKHYAHVRVRQTQDTAFGATGQFAIDLDASLQTAAGTTSTILRSNARDESFVIPLPAPLAAAPGALTLDPNDWYLITGKVEETDANAAPVVVEASPAPNASLDVPPAALVVWLSEPVAVSAAQCSLTGPSGPVAATFAYSPADRRITLTPLSPLVPGTYSLSLADTITAAGIRLDGEIGGGTLPSGDGQPLGAALIGFTVLPPTQLCPADFNADGELNPDDLADFIGAFFAQPPAPGSDFNADGTSDPDDLADFIGAFFSGCP